MLFKPLIYVIQPYMCFVLLMPLVNTKYTDTDTAAEAAESGGQVTCDR